MSVLMIGTKDFAAGYRPRPGRSRRAAAVGRAPALLLVALLLACEGAPRQEPEQLVPLPPARDVSATAAGRPEPAADGTGPTGVTLFREPPAPPPAGPGAATAAEPGVAPAPGAAPAVTAPVVAEPVPAPADADGQPADVAGVDGDAAPGPDSGAGPTGAAAAAAAPADAGAPFPARPEPATRREALAHVRVQAAGAIYRSQEHLTFGVPFIQGILTDPRELRAWRASDAVPVPIQARALSRWADGSVRWALVDLQSELQAHGETTLAVGRAADIDPTPEPWTLGTTRSGGLRLEDGYTTWAVWERGPRGDEIAGLRGRLVDRFEHEYRAVVDPDSVEVLERGPLRVTVRLRGAHRAIDEAGLPIDFHTFTVWAHFLAGVGRVHLEWSLENGPLEEPPGPLAFLDYSLLLDAPAGERRIEPSGAFEAADVRVDLRQGERGASFVVGGRQVPPPDPTQDLWLGVRAGKQDVWVHRVDSAPNHPASLSIAPRGPIVVGLLPRTEGELFFLDDATRKTFRLDLVRDAGDDGRERMSRLCKPAHVALNPIEVLATLAWGDTGLFYLPEAVDLTQPLPGSDDAPRGWAHWGESLARNTHQSGSPRNQLSVFLQALQSGRAEAYRWSLRRAWHAMDLRPYHIQGFLASEFPDANLHEGTPHSNEPARNRLGREEMPQRFPEYKEGLPPGGHGYNGFDPEHMTLDDVYECYLLTGSWPALDALRSAGEAMLTWKEVMPGGWIRSSRTFGWTLRALVQVYRATGEARYIDAARDYVARADAERGKGDVKYLRREKPDPRHLDEPHDVVFMVAVALHGLCAYHHETRDPVVPPMIADLVQFCMSAYRVGGFLPDLPSDRVPTGDEVVTQSLGVSTWVPGAVAAGAFVTGDHEPVDRLLPYYALLKAHTSRPIGFAARDWHWWQAYLASLQRRHGSLAVQNPALFLERSAR